MPQNRLDKLLQNREGALGKLVQAAADSAGLTHVVIDLLPDEFGPHIAQASRPNPGTITITTESSAWAARLRYQTPDLAVALRNTGLEFEIITVNVRPSG